MRHSCIQMSCASKMEIGLTEIESIAKATNLTFTESDDWFKLRIEKENHGFDVQILKSGQYLFVSLLIEKREFPIEHIEFYMQESKGEILEELTVNLNRLIFNESRFSESKKWFKTKMKVEIKENEEWIDFGYAGEETNKIANTQQEL